jgi:N-carbamoyl-L-amino-acid hydrolase
MIDIDEGRLREDIMTNGEFGAVADTDGHGRTVLTGSSADKQAREYLIDRMESRGLDVRVDAVGNIAGRWRPESADRDAAPVAAGSHLDSVPRGGIFDGPLGVYVALEAVRGLQESDVQLSRPVEVVSFTEEEGGRFDVGVLGSSVASGQRTIEDVLEFVDDSGVTLATHLENIGFRGEGRLDAGGWEQFYEVHIEQSTQLEQSGVGLGIVTAITGISNCAVEIEGDSNHAGGTRMNDRNDALLAASTFIQDVNRAGREIVATDRPFAVATIGELEIEPNARNVIPGTARLTTDFRDVEMATMDEIVDRARKSLARIETTHGVETTLTRFRTKAPVPMSDSCITVLRRASERLGVETVALPSGGGHDAMNVATVTDAGMLFARSKDGISHSPQEWTDWEDCATAARVLAETVADSAGATPAARD